MNRVPFGRAELYDWIALQRVSGGAVVRLGEQWRESGRRVPGYVIDALTTLCQRGLVTLVGSDPMRAVLTDAGVDRYESLCQQRALQDPECPA